MYKGTLLFHLVAFRHRSHDPTVRAWTISRHGRVPVAILSGRRMSRGNRGTRQRTTMKLGHGRTEISTYLSQAKTLGRHSVLLSRRQLGLLTQRALSAYFKVASRPESGDWVNCIPNNNVGTFIDKDTLRIGVTLRVRLSFCIPHQCKCGTTVDAIGSYPLSCHFSARRIPRHSALNGVVVVSSPHQSPMWCLTSKQVLTLLLARLINRQDVMFDE